MNELLDFYWNRYYKLLLNSNVPNHMVRDAYIVYSTLEECKVDLYYDAKKKRLKH